MLKKYTTGYMPMSELVFLIYGIAPPCRSLVSRSGPRTTRPSSLLHDNCQDMI